MFRPMLSRVESLVDNYGFTFVTGHSKPGFIFGSLIGFFCSLFVFESVQTEEQLSSL